jgi:hypothetical protein
MRQAAIDLLDRLRRSLSAISGEGATRPSPLIWRKQLLGLRLRWTIEEQVLLPAMQSARASLAGTVALARREIEALRDVVAGPAEEPDASAAWIAKDRRTPALQAVLTAFSELHFDRIDELLLQFPHADDLDWKALHTETQALVQGWEAEWRRSGDIEDEDTDPVGHPPR